MTGSASSTHANMRHRALSAQVLCDNGDGPRETRLTSPRSLTTQLKPDRRRAAMAVTKGMRSEAGDGT
jgi:hypothetical protein